MYSRLHCVTCLMITLAMSAAGAAAAQEPASAAPALTAPSTAAPAAAATLRGHVYDPTGALIPGAAITVTNAAGVSVGTTAADASGAYQVNNLAPGSYIVLATVAGFSPFCLAAHSACRRPGDAREDHHGSGRRRTECCGH